MADYTDDEKQKMRSAAFGAVFLVSKAEPGMVDMIKESFAASKTLSKAPGEMQAVFAGKPKMPKGDPAQMEDTVLAELSSSVATIGAKDPTQLDAYRRAVLDACDSAAKASGGVSSAETAAMAKVMSALGMDAAV